MTSDEQARARELYKVLGKRLHLLEMQQAAAGADADVSLAMEIDDIKDRRAAIFSALDAESVALLDEMTPGQRAQMIQMRQGMSERKLGDQMYVMINELEQRIMTRLTEQGKQQTWALGEMEARQNKVIREMDGKLTHQTNELSKYGLIAVFVLALVLTVVITIMVRG